jgi:3-hydroxybutyryl-CoA dehydrogenase
MITIFGSGTMGKSIAIEFAKFGYRVRLVSVKRKLSSSEMELEIINILKRYNFINKSEVLNNIVLCNNFSETKDTEFFIETLAENIEIKRKYLSEVISQLKKNPIIASNTSSLSTYEIFRDFADMSKVVGLHFFNPVQKMKLVEISYLEKTSQETIDSAKKLIESIDKHPVVLKDSRGFIVNRLLIPMINDAVKIFENGIATIEDIDNSIKLGLNHPMGPLALADLIGIDVVLSILDSLKKSIEGIEVSKLLIKMVDEKKLGRKTGVGFYQYTL